MLLSAHQTHRRVLARYTVERTARCPARRAAEDAVSGRLALSVSLALLTLSAAGCREQAREIDPLPPPDAAETVVTVPDWEVRTTKQPVQPQKLGLLPPVEVEEEFLVEGRFRVRDADPDRKQARRYIAIRVQKTGRGGKTINVHSKLALPKEESNGVFLYRELMPGIRKPGRYALRVFHNGRELVAEGELEVGRRR